MCFAHPLCLTLTDVPPPLIALILFISSVEYLPEKNMEMLTAVTFLLLLVTCELSNVQVFFHVISVPEFSFGNMASL